MMSGKHLLIILSYSSALLSACVTNSFETPQMEAGEWLDINASAQFASTKVQMEDHGDVTSFAFLEGDAIGLYAEEGLFINEKLHCYDKVNGLFTGKATLFSHEARDQVKYYVYYPFIDDAGKIPTEIRGNLSSSQTAPFDARYDYLTASLVNRYDVDNFPNLAFTFGTHLFAIVKLSISDTQGNYPEEELLAIGLKSNGPSITGRFEFDITDPSPTASFVSETEDSKKVSVSFPESSRPTIGSSATHAVYAILQPGEYSKEELTLVVYTTNYKFTIPAKRAINLSNNQVTVLPTVDLSDPGITRTKRVRTMVLWGDSITSYAFHRDVQDLMGVEWDVIRAGVSGDDAYQIASRQGGLPMVTGDEFTLPASAEEYKDIDGIYWRDETDGKYTYGQATGTASFGGGYFPRINPLIISGIECEITYDFDRNQRRIHRLTDGEEMVIPAHTPISTYGSRAYANVDVIAIYMGTNGRPKDSKLLELHNLMKNHVSKETAVFVYGFHQSTTYFPNHWTQDYADLFKATFGDYFIDLHTEGGGMNAIPLMKELGQIKDASEIDPADWQEIERGDWPISWYRSPQDLTHPDGATGSVVMAILLRRHMDKVGLL